MSAKHTPSAGAMRAAKAVLSYLGYGQSEGYAFDCAQIIDSETAAPELLAALKTMMLKGSVWLTNEDYAKARAAIAKATEGAP